MGRLRKNPNAEKYLDESEITITNPNLYIDKWSDEVFKNKKPIWIEIGMGKGEFTLIKAQENSEVNFIGIEKYATVQRIPIMKAKEIGIENLKFISGDASNILEWFNEETIDRIFINFPDPWPKEKHSKRRLVFHTYLNNYYKLLKNGGLIEFKTDQEDLFNFSLEQAEEKTNFKISNVIRDLHSLSKEKNPSPIKTGYENKFSKLGNKINYVEFIKE